MTTIEDRLRDLARAVTPPPLPGANAVMLRARQRRRRRRGGITALLVVAGTGAGVASRGLRSDDGDTVRIAPLSPADDGSGGWEEVPSGGGSGDPGDPGAWEEVPSDGGSGSPGGSEVWDEAPSGPTGSADGSPGQWDEAPAATGGDVDTVVVFDVMGLTVAEGRYALEEVGFLVQVDGNDDDSARVVGQDPAPGTTATVGAVVSLRGA